MAQAIIYTRVSTEEQAKTNQSLDNQEKACREFAKRSGYDVIEVFREEGASAKSTNRKVLTHMLTFCADKKNAVDALIVWKVDRFARNTKDHLTLKMYFHKVGVRLLSVTEPIEDSTSGRLMETMLAGFAQFDNEVRAERSTGGLRARAEQGGWITYAPIGYDNYRDTLGRPTLKPATKYAELVSHLFTQYATGNYTQRQLAERAYKIGLVSRKSGKRLSVQTIANLLRNPAYIGCRFDRSKNELVKALHEPLVSKEIFDRVQDVLSGRHKELRVSKEDNWPLRAGFMRCAECDTPLTGSSPKGRKKYYPKYSCPSCRTSVTGRPVSADREAMHKDFVELLKNIRPQAGHAKLFKAVVLRRWNEEYKALAQEKKRIEGDLTALQERRERAMDLFIDGKLSEEEKNDKVPKIDAERAALRLQLGELQSDVDDKETVIDVAIDFMNNVSSYWSRAPLSLQRRFQNIVFPEGIAYEFGKGFRTAKMGSSYEVIEQVVSKKSNLVGDTWAQWNQLKVYLIEVYQLIKESGSLPQVAA